MNSASATAMEIGAIVVSATVGDVLIASAMRHLGDLDAIRKARGLFRTIVAVATSPRLLAGIAGMAVSFFSLLFALNHGHLSLVAPAATSLTFVSNAMAAKFALKENVDRRRWGAAALICVGVYLVAH